MMENGTTRLVQSPSAQAWRRSSASRSLVLGGKGPLLSLTLLALPLTARPGCRTRVLRARTEVLRLRKGTSGAKDRVKAEAKTVT